MATFGHVLLILAFAAAATSVVTLAVDAARGKASPAALARTGRIATIVSFAALLLCCAILVACFMAGDVSILYVLQERSLSTSSIAWLFKLAGLWAGRAGSLMFWAFLITAFNLVVVLRTRKDGQRLDNVALLVSQAVVLVFTAVLLFSADNMPFTPTPADYFGADGRLTGAASVYGMNQLLEHWAMAIHPPTLFIGYAGLTIPFAYAIAALAVNDPSSLWVTRSTRYVIFSWLFLGAGIGLGAVWAYVVLGWGGYWGWDPVENASLLPWLIGVALIHTFTVYRQRGAFKRWAVMCACLAFVFVIVATFITRSGIVQSVHSFAGDPVSLVLFGGLIVVALAVSIAGIAWRWSSFTSDTAEGDEVDSMLSKDAAYYFNNVIMVVAALLLTYMTLAPALPGFLPFGGDALEATTYESIARPLGILYLLILAVCPLLAWGRTDPAKFLRQARIPAACAAVLFIVLMVVFFTRLKPVYDAGFAEAAQAQLTGASSYYDYLLEAGPPVVYNGLAVLGLLVGSLLFFNALFMLVRSLRTPAKRASAIGGTIAHIGMAVILIGLIGSSMYVTEGGGYIDADLETGVATEEFTIDDYTLTYVDNQAIDQTEASGTVIYEVTFDVARDGTKVGQVSPQVQLAMATQQRKLNASVLHFAGEDLFVIYYGVNYEGDYALEAKINPLVSLVWIGSGLLLLGGLVALVGRRRAKAAGDSSPSAQNDTDEAAQNDTDEAAQNDTGAGGSVGTRISASADSDADDPEA